ncbi:hypothetical protein PTTG_30295 [Puccinia triticina 1-1 BBBD Race 1]|uniref:Uncharacterized protein n=1 Tax=Puccinia triticina (isolate 1-1 / race 1 (BBBD)) TaxID=630390 RepID=A0A180FZB6_PUCT1|nr:hypothetical protein PTTG_30295 [Puccinia triticina 1-1 BBBD Race 1]
MYYLNPIIIEDSTLEEDLFCPPTPNSEEDATGIPVDNSDYSNDNANDQAEYSDNKIDYNGVHTPQIFPARPAQASFPAKNIPLRGAQNFHHAMELEFVEFATATHRDKDAV